LIPQILRFGFVFEGYPQSERLSAHLAANPKLGAGTAEHFALNMANRQQARGNLLKGRLWGCSSKPTGKLPKFLNLAHNFLRT
jgi:hypothetical protein